MKKICLIIISIIVCINLVSCSVANNDNDSGGAHVVNNTESRIGENDLAMDLSIVYSPNVSTDRAFLSSELLDRRMDLSLEEDRGCAICLVTATDIDFDKISNTKSARLPLTLRIDRIISSNESFTLNKGDTFLTAGYWYWVKTGDEYTVSYADGVIPITERGAQYIVMLTEEAFDDISFDIEYRTECYTVPISATRVTADEIAKQYAEMQLPEDVRKLSTDLIKREFGEDFIPGFDEIETALENEEAELTEFQAEKLKELEDKGAEMVGSYLYQEKVIKGEAEATIDRMDLQEVRNIVAENNHFEDILISLESRQPYPDFIGGSGVTLIEYWFDSVGDEKILIILEQSQIYHISNDGSKDSSELIYG